MLVCRIYQIDGIKSREIAGIVRVATRYNMRLEGIIQTRRRRKYNRDDPEEILPFYF